MDNDNTWIMIPARGGSRGLPRKNVRLLGNVPLIMHAIRTCCEAVSTDRIVVVTDDDEIDSIASYAGVRVMREEETTGKATLDDVAVKTLPFLKETGARPEDIFLTVQPTCPFLQSERITQAQALFSKGAASVISVVDDRHLGWRLGDGGTPEPDYTARVNRQMLPAQFRETGAIIGCRIRDLMTQKTRIIQPIRLLEVSNKEAIDIDDFSDWAVAKYYMDRRNIVIRADANRTLGMGHVFRALAVAQELAQYKVTLLTDQAGSLAFELLSQSPFDVFEVDGDVGFLNWLEANPADLTILDQLDTESDYMRAVKARSRNVVTFEDLGPGALEADLVICDLYKNLDVPEDRQLTGISNAILAPSFETLPEPAPFNDTVHNILLLFGGTDPSCLTEKALTALKKAGYSGRCTVVIGPGFGRDLKLETYGLEGEIYQNLKYMPGVMRKADLAVSSAGRTITELTSIGIPVLCICQNDKELTHTHASARFGVVNLGLGALAEPASIAAHIQHLIDNSTLRRTLRTRALHETSGRSNGAIIERMLARLDF